MSHGLQYKWESKLPKLKLKRSIKPDFGFVMGEKSNISQIKINLIFQVTNALRTLNCHNGKKKIRERFSEMMTYRRNHLKNTKFWKRSEKVR